MKIGFLGNFSVDYSTESDWRWTYEHLGHEVITFQETGPNPSTTDEIWAACQDIDIFHYVHTHEAITPGSFPISELIQRFKNKGIVTIGYHLDYWRGLEREKDVGTHPWWTLDYIFTADGGSNKWYRDKGINHYYIKAGVVERDCYIGNYREEFACDVAFVGSYHYHPEWPYRARLIDWLQETYGDRFRRYAGDTEWGTIRGSALNDLYASVKVVVGDTLCLGFNHPDYFSDRLFETTGRGGFLIFPEIIGIHQLFHCNYSWDDDARGSHHATPEIMTYKYQNFGDLKDKIDQALSENWYADNRRKVALAGYERTKRDHTYTQRAKEIFEILKKDGRI